MDSPLPNRFRQRILARERLIGFWMCMSSHITAELAGLADFDWLLLDGEHSPNEVPMFLQQLQALQSSASAAVGRPSWNDPVEIKRMLDIGFYNLLIPFIESEADARRAVAATRYPPQGMRGVAGAQRSNRYGTVPNYLQTINDNICVLLQIESRPGIEAVDEIASVEGVDGVFIGPSDLAAALGISAIPAIPRCRTRSATCTSACRRRARRWASWRRCMPTPGATWTWACTSWRWARTWACSSRRCSGCARPSRRSLGPRARARRRDAVRAVRAQLSSASRSATVWRRRIRRAWPWSSSTSASGRVL